jgi:hypothetical protein
VTPLWARACRNVSPNTAIGPNQAPQRFAGAASRFFLLAASAQPDVVMRKMRVLRHAHVVHDKTCVRTMLPDYDRCRLRIGGVVSKVPFAAARCANQ